jgi:DNA-binding SARP family transcriptional activator
MIDATKLTPEELTQRANHVERLMQDPLLNEAFANLRINYFEEWMATDPKDTIGREALYMAARAVSHVENHFRLVISARPIDSKMEALKKVQALRRDSIRRDPSQRAGNAPDVNTL